MARSTDTSPDADGHTLYEALEQVEILTDQRPDLAFVDRGYRGHGVEHGRPAWRYPNYRKTPATAQCNRTHDRAHEKRRPPVQIPLKGPEGTQSSPCSAAAATTFA